MPNSIVAFTQTPGEVSGGNLTVVICLKADTPFAQHLVQPIMIGQRTIVDQAKIQPGWERVQMFSGDGRFGGHAGMTERMTFAVGKKFEILNELMRRTLAFEYLDYTG